MGRYYPPDASKPPTFNSTSHPLGKRANKISQGILTVRFELPFAVWCEHCTPPALIGQGVRFNAQKQKVGKYYSTPIWSFRMKHSACGGVWEIRTDPQKSEYVVVGGARRRDYGSAERGPEAEEGDLKVLTEEERERRRGDAFAGLEGKMEDKWAQGKNGERVEELYEMSEVWRDPYEINARMRNEFRAKRKIRRKEERYKEDMQNKFSLGLDIVEETDADRARASLVEFGGAVGTKTEEPSWKPLFGETKTSRAVAPVPKTKKLKAEMAAEKSRRDLQQTLVGNTRAVIDPFLSRDSGTAFRVDLGLLKRKRDTQMDEESGTKPFASPEPTVTPMKSGLLPALYDYDSD
ncbi:DUF572-domain-containing protein [Decorospora gaudefroyi]|uniref:DUF572-domain-containing protein n=1 Tax=Decorospora gaudefroyi TaxID=184978 RepID=A0A6A5K589_9PLEO|nr:DUF572-domain-containing protein [Decorospora gaudefroyi]